MATEVRLRELCAINNNIITESNKMMNYLKIIKERSEYAISCLNSLNTAIFLRRYSGTYEYLNKFYIKLVDQNCMFELFFLEMDEPDTNDMMSAHTSARDLNSEIVFHNTNLAQHKLKTVKSESPMSVHVHAKEFIPKSNTDSSTSKDVIIENSCSSKSDNIVPDKQQNKSATPVSDLTQENVAQHNLLSTNMYLKTKHSHQKQKTCAEKQNCAVETQSCAVEQTKTPLKAEEEKKDAPEKQNNVLDVKDALKKVNEKIKQNELKSAIPIPDLRPSVVQKDDGSSSAQTNQSTDHSAQNTKSTHSYTSHKKSQHKNNNNKKTDNLLQNIEIGHGSTPKEGDICYISSIDSPSSFYIQVIRDENTLIDSLSNQIKELNSSLKMFYNKQDARRCIKNYCVCFINTYSAWCRVEITNWLIDHEQLIEVRLIDYGLSAKVPLRNIREGNQFLFKLPQMADKCELAWARPLNGTENWSQKSSDHFKKIVNDNDRYFTISYVSEYNSHLVIDLQNNDIESVAGLMISDEMAMDSEQLEENKNWSNDFMKKQIVQSQGFTEDEFNEMEEDRLEELLFGDEDDDEVTNPNLAVSHHIAKDEIEVCRIFLSRGHCFKGKNCSFSHKPLNPDGWTTDREEVYKDSINHLNLPPNGSEVTVKIVNIIDLKSFYVVIKKLPMCPELIGMPVYNIRTLVKLMNEENHRRLTVIPASGEILLVKFEEQWQRGRVINVEEYANRIELEVLLVDFGIIRTFNMKNCRKIRDKHLLVPFQVVLCTLCNVSMKDNLTDEENQMGCDYLEMHVENKKLKAKVVYSAEFLNVHLYNENGQDIGEELIKAGLVNRCPVITCTEPGLLVD